MGILKRLVDFLAPLGFILAVAAVAWSRISPFGKALPGELRYYLLAALALVLAHLVLRFEDVMRLVGRRQLKYGGNTLVLVLAVLGILAGVNYVVARNTKRFDLTKDQRYSLSDQTRKVVSGLQQDVKITYFQRSLEMARGQDRIKEYQALSPRIKAEFVDPIKSPAKAQAYDVRGPWPILVVELGDKRVPLIVVDPVGNATKRRPPRRPAHERPHQPVDFDPGRTLTTPKEDPDEIF